MGRVSGSAGLCLTPLPTPRSVTPTCKSTTSSLRTWTSACPASPSLPPGPSAPARSSPSTTTCTVGTHSGGQHPPSPAPTPPWASHSSVLGCWWGSRGALGPSDALRSVLVPQHSLPPPHTPWVSHSSILGCLWGSRGALGSCDALRSVLVPQHSLPPPNFYPCPTLLLLLLGCISTFPPPQPFSYHPPSPHSGSGGCRKHPHGLQFWTCRGWPEQLPPFPEPH